MKWLKRIGLGVLVIYILLTFRIIIQDNHDVYLRILPLEKIEYLFVPGKLKKAYKEFEHKEGICKRLDFSKERILFSKNGILYESAFNNNQAETKVYIPEYSYTVTDCFEIKLNMEYSKYYEMVCFSIFENDKELYSSYFTVCETHEIVFSEYNKDKIYELLSTHKDAKFIITECRE